MAKRKYTRYQVVTEFETIESEDYQDARCKYFHEDGNVTLYGITFEGDFSVIFSK